MRLQRLHHRSFSEVLTALRLQKGLPFLAPVPVFPRRGGDPVSCGQPCAQKALKPVPHNCQHLILLRMLRVVAFEQVTLPHDQPPLVGLKR